MSPSSALTPTARRRRSRKTVALALAGVTSSLTLSAMGGAQPAQAAAPTLSVVARADLMADGVPARMGLYVNGMKVATTPVTSTSWNTYSYDLPSSASANSKIDVVFENDGWDGKRDRNLHIRSVSDGTTTRLPTTATLDRGNTYPLATDGKDTLTGREGILWSGALRWSGQAGSQPTSPTTPPTTTPPKTSPARATDPIWPASSVAYRKLPANAPISPTSQQIMTSITKAGIAAYGNTSVTPNLPSMTVNTQQYTTPYVTAHNSDPVYDISFDNCQNKSSVPTSWLSTMKGVHIPVTATPSVGTDGALSIWNADPDAQGRHRLVELWVAKKHTDSSGKVTGWSACWGGSIADTLTSEPRWTQYGHGVSASGLTLNGFSITVAELQAGKIKHPVAMGLLPGVINSAVSGFATRTDGAMPVNGATISEGQYLRLDPRVFTDSYIESQGYGKFVKMMVYAARDYGFIVTDRSGANVFGAQASQDFATNPWPAIFEGRPDWAVMWGDAAKGYKAFPWYSMQVVQFGYVPPVS